MNENKQKETGVGPTKTIPMLDVYSIRVCQSFAGTYYILSFLSRNQVFQSLMSPPRMSDFHQFRFIRVQQPFRQKTLNKHRKHIKRTSKHGLNFQ